MDAKPTVNAREISVTHLKFNIVVSSDKRVIGTIDDLVMHKETHEFAYAVLKVDRLLGLGNKRIPIPIPFLEVDEEKPFRIKLTIPREKLKNAPKCGADNLSSICQDTFLKALNEYYQSEVVFTKSGSRLRNLFKMRLQAA